MVYVKDPVPQLFEIGYSLGLIHHELCSQSLNCPGIRVADQMDGCLSAARTIRDRAETQKSLTAAAMLRVNLEAVELAVVKASSAKSRGVAAERVRGVLAQARSAAEALSSEHGRPWLALGAAVGAWEMAPPRKAPDKHLRQCWDEARKLVNEPGEWIDTQIAYAKKERERVGSLANAFRDLLLDAWEYDREGKHYVDGHRASRAEYKVLITLFLMRGEEMEVEDLARLSCVAGAHNTLSRLRKNKNLCKLISGSAPARWIEASFPEPEPYAIPEDLHEFVLARVKDVKP